MTYTRKNTQMPAPGVRRPTMPQVRPRFAGLSRSAAALFRVRTYRARMAAALMIVAGSLLYQTGAEALEQSSKQVLYLDAPTVSVPQAEKAGETARGYAGPDSNVDDAVLAWVDVKPVPLEARKAFASITVPSGPPPGGVSYDDAVAAGDDMVAQLGGDSPTGGEGEDEELASADPIRPKLGDGTKATDAPAPDATEPSPGTGGGSQQPEYAAADTPAPSDLGLPVPMAEQYALEPSGGRPPASSGDELAAAPEEGSEVPEDSTGGNSATGPISGEYSPEVGPEDTTELGSSDTGDSAPQNDETSPAIVVPDTPESGDEPEQEYAGVPEGSGTEPQISESESSESDGPETENVGTPPDEASNEPSTEPSPGQPSPAPNSEEQESEDPPDLVAVVQYEPGTEEGQEESQEGPGQSSQPPEEVPAETTPGISSEPSSEEDDSTAPEPGQQQEMPEQAAASPTPAEKVPAGEGPAVQPEAESNSEPGDSEDKEDLGSDEELPEGVRVKSSDEAGVQKLSVVVHQESDAADNPASNSPDVQESPEEESAPSERPSPASQENEDDPSNGRGGSNNPKAGRGPEPDTSSRPNSESPDRPGRPPAPGSEHGNDPETDQNDHNPEGSYPAPQPETGDEQESSSTQSHNQPEQTSVANPEPTPASKDQAPRQNAEGSGWGSQSNNPAQYPIRGRDEARGKQQRPQPKGAQPSQPAPEPAVEQGWVQPAQQVAEVVPDQGIAEAAIPIQDYSEEDIATPSSEVVSEVDEVDSYVQEAVGNTAEIATPPESTTDPHAESYSEPVASTYEAPAAQDTTGYVEEVVQEVYGQEAVVDPYVEDVAAGATPAATPVPDPTTYGGAVDSTSYAAAAAALPESYAEPAPTETYVEPVSQVPAQELEPVQQVQTQELEPAPPVANVIESQSSQPAVAEPSAALPAHPAQPAQQQVAPSVDATIHPTISAGGGE